MRMVGGSYRTAWLLIPWALYSVNASQDNRNRDLAGRSPPPPPPPPPRPGDPRQYADSNFPDNGDFPEAQSTAYWDEIEQDFPAGEQNYRRRRSRPPPKNAFGGPTSDYRDQDLGDYRNDYPEPEGSWPYESKQPPSPLGGTSNDRVSMRPPPENAQQYAPIHYNFPKEKEKKKKFGFFGRKKKDKDATPPPLFSEMEDSTRRQRSRPTTDDGDEDFIPETFSAPPPRDRFTRDSDDNAPMYQSPRRDVITQFRSTFNGRVILALSSGIAGSLLGAFLGKVSPVFKV